MKTELKRRAEATSIVTGFLAKCANDMLKLEEMAKIAGNGQTEPKPVPDRARTQLKNNKAWKRFRCLKCRRGFESKRSRGQHQRRCPGKLPPVIVGTARHSSPCGRFKSKNKRAVGAHQGRCVACAKIRIATAR